MSAKRYVSILTSLAILGGVLITSLPIASAQLGMAIRPLEGTDIMAIEGEPGEVIEEGFRVTNTNNEVQTVGIYTVDAYSNAQGQYVLSSFLDEQIAVGTWIELDDLEMTVLAQETVNSTFRLTIPETATPGYYVGAVLVSTPGSEIETMGGSGAVNIAAIGMRTYVNVVGDRIVDFSWDSEEHQVVGEDSHVITLSLANNGNVIMSPSGTITIKPLIGEEQVLDIEISPLMPTQSGEYNIYWDEAPIIGFFKATIEVAVSEFDITGMSSNSGSIGETEQREISFWIIPVKEIAGAIIVFIIVFTVLFLRRHRYQKLLKIWKSKTIMQDSSLPIVAQKWGVNWKLLAKVNKIKSPYVVIKGQ
ncbi:DUF916 domain-containing protein, partial [Candidatus Falkowbacteria bacterium]|nr:DUF916 domain-containing protein [Candidatus Falkowbacteria bacterium]